MLAREHRLRTSDEIREVVKSGKRVSNQIATIHFLPGTSNQFAVVASKTVGNSVTRNLARRRSKAVLFDFQDKTPAIRAVIRLRPEAASCGWPALSEGLRDLLGKIK